MALYLLLAGSSQMKMFYTVEEGYRHIPDHKAPRNFPPRQQASALDTSASHIGVCRMGRFLLTCATSMVPSMRRVGLVPRGIEMLSGYPQKRGQRLECDRALQWGGNRLLLAGQLRTNWFCWALPGSMKKKKHSPDQQLWTTCHVPH